ncbi:hypothetical protein CK203_063155 [Vitis vinifera]|uniref:DUF4283 domain-containing protein n=1 Tax=Vitis vinifera TaxID=29760 RepID=A0A438FRK1_VITVI|nr:hypothetical protein CK203_063155 [Vitis vinifera]
MLVGGRRGWRRRRVAGKGLTRPHAPAREMQSPAGKWRVAGAWILFWCRCLHKSWRSPPGAPSGMVGVGKIGRRKSSPESSPENFAGGEWFLTTFRLTESIGRWGRSGEVVQSLGGWREGFRLERCANGGEIHSVMCLLRRVRGFPWSSLMGEVSLGGGMSWWEKLHLLEVVLKAETKIVGSTTEKWRSSLVDSKKGSYVEAVKKDLRMVGEAVWVQIGEWDVQSRLDQLNCCPVGKFEEDPKSKPDLLSLRNWDGSEAERVLARGSKRLKGKIVHLESQEVFKKLGDCCGGFLAVDEDTAMLSHLQWARILVKSDDKGLPGSLQRSTRCNGSKEIVDIEQSAGGSVSLSGEGRKRVGVGAAFGPAFPAAELSEKCGGDGGAAEVQRG